MSDAAKQSAYEAKRRAATGLKAVPMIEYRVFLPDGREVIERVIGLSMVAAYYPDAWKVERVDATTGGFW
jgi:hypothetical protein